MADRELTSAPSRTVRVVDSDPDANEALRRVRASRLFSTPTDVETCQAEYAAGADVRRKFDATARRQYRAA